jgi:aryl-alcohol dehydrogenase-like predicted oxidoreductase
MSTARASAMQYIGRFAKQCATPLTIATKFGRGADMFPDSYTKEKVRKSIEDSLARLQLDQLDLMHSCGSVDDG